MKNHIIAIIILIIALNLYFLPKDKEVSNDPYLYPNPININIEGEVAFPGTYTFYSSVTLSEVINYAGGLLITADNLNLNYNEVYLESTVVKVNSNEYQNNEHNLVYDLNDVTFEQLKTLNNITDKRAANIIIYREQHGRFKSLEELLEVKNIGKATYEKIKNNFTV